MDNHFQLTDESFENQFERAVLNPALFTHEAHLRLAWIHIDKYGLAKAEENVCAQLLKFVDKVGARDKFNLTLTIAAVKIVFHFYKKAKSTNVKDFLKEFPRLQTHFKTLLEQHYKTSVYTSVLSKTNYLQPDLLPFDE